MEEAEPLREVSSGIGQTGSSLASFFSTKASVDSFLYFLQPKKVNSKSILFGLSLIVALRIWAGLCLIIALGEFFQALKEDKIVKIVAYLSLCIMFLVIAAFSLASTIKNTEQICRVAYHTSAIVFLIDFLGGLAYVIIDIIEFIYIFSDDFLKLKDLFYVIGFLFSMIIFLYFVWLTYCQYQISKGTQNTSNENAEAGNTERIIENNNNEHKEEEKEGGIKEE